MVTEIERKRGRGRPVGKRFKHKRVFYLDDDGLQLVEALRKRFPSGESGIVRRAIEELAERELAKR